MGAPLQTLPRATADVGLQFIERYARASVKNEFRSRALPAGFDADDLVAEIHIALCETLGPDYPEQIGKALLNQFQGEMAAEAKRTLRRCVRRGIGRPQWASNKRVQRERSHGRHFPQEETLGNKEIASPLPAVDELIDLASILETFDVERRVIWDGLVAGRTLREIGTELGLSHQQVHRRSLEVLRRVARYFGHAG